MNFWDIWNNFKKKAVRKSKTRLASRGPNPTPTDELAAAERSVEHWGKIKKLAEHREALMDVMTDDVIVATNRLFSVDARPEQINFDRGLLSYVFTLSSRLSRAAAELEAAQKRTELLKREHGIEITEESDAGA